MTIQFFAAGPSAVTFPQLVLPGTNLLVSTAQLRKMWYHAPAQKLVGVFTTAYTDWSPYTGNPHIQAAWRLNYLWRDGGNIDINTTPIRGYGSLNIKQTQTVTGTVVTTELGDNIATDELSATQGDALYPLSEVWAQDILPVRYASASVLGASYEMSYLTTASAGYIAPVSAPNFRVIRAPNGSIVFSATGATWNQPRDMVYIDGERTAVTFMQVSGATVDASSPALIRLFKTTTDPWQLLWTDTLPGADSVMAYDPTYAIVYSCAKWPGSAVMHASKLKQAPASLSVLTLLSGSTLQEMRATLISVLVTDGQGSGLSGALVCWTLSASTSGGTLLSAYTRTNASGVAYATYIGPRLSGTTTTDFVSAAVATLEPVGV